MGSDMGVEVVPKEPPDFTKWDLKDEISVHVFPSNPRKPKWQTADRTDERMDSWMAYVNNYLRDFGNGVVVIGNEYQFFGKEPRLKYWGLRGDIGDHGETPLHSFAIFRDDGVWEVFSNIESEAGYNPVFGSGSECKRVVAAELTVSRRKTEAQKAKELFTITIQR